MDMRLEVGSDREMCLAGRGGSELDQNRFVHEQKIVFRCVALRADVMLQPQRLLAGASVVRVDVVRKDDLLLLRHALPEMHTDVPVTGGLSCEREAHLGYVTLPFTARQTMNCARSSNSRSSGVIGGSYNLSPRG